MSLRLASICASLFIAGTCSLSVYAADTSDAAKAAAPAAGTSTDSAAGAPATGAPAAGAPAPGAAPAAASDTAAPAKKTADDSATGAPAAGAPEANGSKALYTVKDGNKVDNNTLEGWKTWRALSCARCHGAKQEGLVGPSLINAFKTMTPEEFKLTVTKGRVSLGMPSFGGVPRVVENVDNLYAYLKGRSDGKIEPGHLYPIEK